MRFLHVSRLIFVNKTFGEHVFHRIFRLFGNVYCIRYTYTYVIFELVLDTINYIRSIFILKSNYMNFRRRFNFKYWRLNENSTFFRSDTGITAENNLVVTSDKHPFLLKQITQEQSKSNCSNWRYFVCNSSSPWEKKLKLRRPNAGDDDL